MIQNQPSVSAKPKQSEKASELLLAREGVLDRSRVDLNELDKNIQGNSPEGGMSEDTLEELELMEAMGISSDVLLSDSEWTGSKLSEQEQEQQITHDKELAARFQVLVEKQSVSGSLSILRREFNGKLDEKSLAVLAQYEALVSPVTIPDKQEREVVGRLLRASFTGDLSDEAFAGLVFTVYEQPDSVISKETKKAIEKKFDIPREPIRTGEDLMNRVLMKDAEGKPVYASSETALKVREDVHVYILPSGEVRIVPMSKLPASEIRMTPFDMRDHQRWVDYTNFSIVTALIVDELDGLRDVFGSDRQSLVHRPDAATMKKMDRLVEAFLDRKRKRSTEHRVEMPEFWWLWRLRCGGF